MRLKALIEQYKPKSADEQKFADKHIVAKHDDVAGNKDDIYQGKNVKPVDRKKDNHGYNPGEDEKVYEEVEPVQEVLKPSMGIAAYIRDFKKSDDPRFEGDSQGKRRQRAIAAYMQDKKGGMNEGWSNSYRSQKTAKHAAYNKRLEAIASQPHVLFSRSNKFEPTEHRNGEEASVALKKLSAAHREDALVRPASFPDVPKGKKMYSEEADLLSLYANLTDENKAVMIKMIDEGRKEELLSFYSEMEIK